MAVIRILHVIGSLNMGGSQSFIMEVYRKIDRSKIQFDFLIHYENQDFYKKEIEELGGKTYFLPAFLGYNIMQYKKGWRDFYLNHPEYRIVHAHVRSTASIYLEEAKKKGCYTIAHSHNTSSGKGITAVIKNLLQYGIRYKADYFMACSESAGKWLFGKKILKGNQYKLVHNAIDLKRFATKPEIRQYIRGKHNLENAFVLGNVARLTKQKNHMFLLDIFCEIQKRLPNSRLLLVGDGELKEQLENRVHNLKIKNKVIFIGDSKKPEDYLQAMDLLIFPSLYEGLGITLIEAQAVGVRCLVSERIPREAFITSNIFSYPIKKGASAWAKYALELGSEVKGVAKDEGYKIKNLYDVNIIASKFQEFYLMKWRENNDFSQNKF